MKSNHVSTIITHNINSAAAKSSGNEVVCETIRAGCIQLNFNFKVTVKLHMKLNRQIIQILIGMKMKMDKISIVKIGIVSVGKIDSNEFLVESFISFIFSAISDLVALLDDY